MHKSLWALPGFLGLPTDWEPLQIEGLNAVDLSLFPMTSLEEWAQRFNRWVEEKEASSFSSSRLLMGYSLGGRLALHALIGAPTFWQAAVIVSTHPGLKSEEEKRERLRRDLCLANRFERENWDQLMLEWNQQPVFAADRFVFSRSEKDYNRRFLASLLRQGSLAQQKALQEAISQLPMPILWVVGEEDKRCVCLAKELRFSHPASSLVIVPKAGHRLIWSHRDFFRKLIYRLLHEPIAMHFCDDEATCKLTPKS